MLPLSGVKILDATHVIAGPFASYQLCLMGAEAVRVERLGGNDFIRHHAGSDDLIAAGLGGSFSAQNAGKKCILLNLKDPRGRDVFLKLAAESDVVIENYRPGVMDRLRVGYDDICAVKPDIIYCSLSGYGDVGPLKDTPAYDHIVQGMSGLMSMTGTAESGPQRAGLPITDYIAGLTAALAVTGALHQRKVSGDGQHLQVPMLASVLAFMGTFAIDQQTTGQERGLQGNIPFSGSPFAGRFDAADGYLTVALERAFRLRTATAWEGILGDVSVPAGKVRNLGDILAHPQTAASGCLDDLPLPGRDVPLKLPGLGFTSDSWKRAPLRQPDTAGESTKDVMRALGYSAEEITALTLAGVIAGPDTPKRE